MRTLALACALAACGGGSSTKKDTTPDNTQPQQGEVTAQVVCEKILAMREERCELVAGYDQDAAGCIAEYDESIAAGGEAKRQTEALGRCFVDQPTCEGVVECVTALFAGEGEDDQSLPLRACDDVETYGAVGYPADQWAQRRGAAAAKFSDVTSSLEQPIEVCDVEGQLEWLTRTTCDDGKNPFDGDPAAAHAARTGSAGTGGRCGAIVDHYVVPCPERSYDVYIDMYVCPLR